MIGHSSSPPDASYVCLVLSKSQKLTRWYGVWWDILNLGIAALLLASLFIVLSINIMSGRLDSLPFQNLLWEQFIATVPAEKQSEIGLNMLSISFSAGSAVALYLVKIGTSRWANNRRVGLVLGYYAERILGETVQPSQVNHSSALSAFIDASDAIFFAG